MKNINLKRASLGDFLQVLKWTLTTYFKTSPYLTTGFLIGRIFKDLNSLIYVYFLAKILDTIILGLQNQTTNIDSLYKPLIMLFSVTLFGELLSGPLFRFCRNSLRRQYSYIMESIFYHKLDSLRIADLENPDFANEVKRAKEWMYDTMYILEESISIFSSVVMVIISAAIVYSTIPYFLPVILFITFIRFIPQKKYMKENFQWYLKHTEGERIASETGKWLLGKGSKLQEIRMSSTFNYFDKNYQTFFKKYNLEFIRVYQKQELAQSFFEFVDAFVGFATYLFMFSRVIVGSTTVGTVTIIIRSIDNFSNHLNSLLSGISYLYDFALKASDLIKLMNMKPTVIDGTVNLPNTSNPPEIEFINVSFKYPQSDKFVFENLNIKIKSGEKVAIVGHNGAGKTTLVKLISRAYDVTSGEILINGININDIVLEDLYSQIGVLFQSYNFYDHLSVKDNIFVGRADKPIDENKIVEAAINADADEFINEYPNKYNQLMSERYEGGISPSGGQEQKIAIARFFYRDAPLAIFDEPTSAIDAVSEYKIFNRIYSFFQNKTVIIISHRFSTVRNADRILVMDHGKIVEEGTHDELLKLNGNYAHAFKLQAEGYRS